MSVPFGTDVEFRRTRKRNQRQSPFSSWVAVRDLSRLRLYGDARAMADFAVAALLITG